MNSGCFLLFTMYASRILQGCCKDSSSIHQGYFEHASRMDQGFCKGEQSMFQRCLVDASLLYASRISYGCIEQGVFFGWFNISCEIAVIAGKFDSPLNICSGEISFIWQEIMFP
jgi:hypothetical protein